MTILLYLGVLALIGFASNVWVHWIVMPVKIRLIRKFPHTPTRWKPIDCEQCMATWLTFAFFVSEYGFSWQPILYAGAGYIFGGLFSYLFVLHLNRIYGRAITRKRFL